MKKYYSWIVTGALMVCLGLFILLNTEKAIVIMVMGFGLYTLFNGALGLLATFRLRGISPFALSLNLFKSALNIVVGVFAVMMASSRSGEELGVWIVYIIAITLLISALSELLESVILYSASAGFGFTGTGIVSLILSVIMFLCPNFISTGFLAIIGVGAVIIGALNVVWGIRTWRLVHAIMGTNPQQNVAEAEFTEKNE
ncbi:MAG: DUF308 domain-containing protein [Spirochaetales bacterium]|nr:DUF308 domain-containing protein [Spirochaetales bacterium]